MNIKYILLALSLALPLQVCAQKEGDKKDKKEKTEKVKKEKDKKNKKDKGNKNTPKPEVTPGLIVDTIKQTTTLPLPPTGALPVVTGQPTAPATDPAQLRIVRDSLAEAKRRLDAAYAERNDLRGQTDSLKALINSLDPIIYKECILYPLSIRYNQQRIDESLRAVRSYRKAVGDNYLSADFKQCIKTYLPFIEGTNPQYKQYSDELVRFLEKVADDLKNSKTEVMQTEMKNKCMQLIMQLTYYKYYKQRNTPPYKSIPFLDNALDSFKVLLNDSRSVVDDVQRLRKSITPKQ